MVSSFLCSTIPLVCIFPKYKRFLFCSNYYLYNGTSFNVCIYCVFRFYFPLWALTQLFNFCFSLCLLPPSTVLYLLYYFSYFSTLWTSRSLFYLSSLNATTFPSSKKDETIKILYFLIPYIISMLLEFWSIFIFGIQPEAMHLF